MSDISRAYPFKVEPRRRLYNKLDTNIIFQERIYMTDSINKEGITISRDLRVLQQETGHNTKTLQRTQVRGKKSIIGGSSLSLKCQFPKPLVF